VVEGEHPRSAGHPLDERFDLVVVAAADRFRIVEVVDRRGMTGERESLLVE
jgi:hypothetical protein